MVLDSSQPGCLESAERMIIQAYIIKPW